MTVRQVVAAEAGSREAAILRCEAEVFCDTCDLQINTFLVVGEFDREEMRCDATTLVTEKILTIVQ